MNKYMYFFQKATYFQQLWFTARCNSILPTLEALISLLKETKTIGKNLDKIRARDGGERANQEKVVVDA